MLYSYCERLSTFYLLYLAQHFPSLTASALPWEQTCTDLALPIHKSITWGVPGAATATITDCLRIIQQSSGMLHRGVVVFWYSTNPFSSLCVLGVERMLGWEHNQHRVQGPALVMLLPVAPQAV